MSQLLVEGSKRMVVNSLDDHLSEKLLPGYNERSLSVDAISWSQVMDCSSVPCFPNLGTDGKYEHVAPFLHTIPVLNSRCANIFCLSHYMLFLKHIICVSGVANAVNKSTLLRNLSQACNKAEQVKNGPLVLPFFSKRQSHALRKAYTTLQRFADTEKHPEAYCVLWISRKHLMLRA